MPAGYYARGAGFVVPGICFIEGETCDFSVGR